MKRILSILFLGLALPGVAEALPASAFNAACPAQDSVSKVVLKDGDKVLRNKMSISAYPVELHMVGNAVRVQSPEKQILPIYNESGAFYLVMRLNKGTNWLNGLPKGKYYINHKLISIR